MRKWNAVQRRFMKACTLAAAFAFSALLFTSCAWWFPVAHRVPFDEAEFAGYGAAGSGTVEGRIAVKGEDDGELHVGGDAYLTLLPVTSYTTEMVEREIGNGEMLGPSDARLRKYLRAATADDQGNFVFNHVPPGDYYLTGLVEWDFGDDAQYQWACEKISVGKGETVRVTVSRDLHLPGHPYLVVWRLE
jgi:hypothetical protein